jgi:hypothetical protein
MYEGVLTSDLSKRILLGDTDSIDDRLCQVEMKIQKLEAKSHAEIQNLSNTIHVLQQKGKFLYLNTLSRQLTFKKYLKIPKGQSETANSRRANNAMVNKRTDTDLQNTTETTKD